MWITPPCGSIFRCNADHHDVGTDATKQRGTFIRCGSKYFHPAPGQTRLNCSCEVSPPQKSQQHATAKHFFSEHDASTGAQHTKRACGEHIMVDTSGGVSSAYRRLPMREGANPAVKCCRNKPTAKGPVESNMTLQFTQRDYAAFPAACEALCDAEPSGRCRYFSHSFRFQNCILCAACEPEIMLGDDTYASFQRATEDPTQLYTGVLA